MIALALVTQNNSILCLAKTQSTRSCTVVHYGDMMENGNSIID